MSLCVAFERLTNKLLGWCSLSMLLNFSKSKAFHFLSYSPVSSMDIGYILSSNPKNMYFHRGFLWEQTFPICSPTIDYFVSFNERSTNQMH